MTYQSVKGMEDYYPPDYATYKYIVDKLAEEARKYGFQQVSTPAAETMKLLTAKSGEEVKQQIFVLEQRGTEELGLRFDLTVPMTRMFVTKQKELQKPVKWFQAAPMWRYEAPQAGRQREFTQLSVELFGSDKPEADATCINLIISCMESFGLKSKDVKIKINNRKLLEGLLLEAIPKEKLEEATRIIDKSSKIGEVAFTQELQKTGIKDQAIEVIKKIIKIQGPPASLDKIKELKPNELANAGLKELQETLKYVNGEYILVDLSIARGLAYYTGNVFECFDVQGKYRALAGGGRYDQLVGLFGGDETPATGFAIGTTTLTLLLNDRKLIPKQNAGPEYYIAPVNNTMLPKALEIAERIRKRTSVDVDLMQRKLAKQIEYADSIGAQKIVIVGEKDLAEGNVTVRELATGNEQKYPVNKLH